MSFFSSGPRKKPGPKPGSKRPTIARFRRGEICLWSKEFIRDLMPFKGSTAARFATILRYREEQIQAYMNEVSLEKSVSP